MDKENVIQILEVMGRSEQAVRDLYRACAEQWPDDAKFWLGIAKQEERHMENVQKMIQLISSDAADYKVQRTFTLPALQTFVSWIKEVAEKVKAGRLDKQQILGTSLDFENSLIERNFIDIISSENPEFQSLVKETIDETNAHRRSIADRLKNL